VGMQYPLESRVLGLTDAKGLGRGESGK